jgi:hypothetical protein
LFRISFRNGFFSVSLCGGFFSVSFCGDFFGVSFCSSFFLRFLPRFRLSLSCCFPTSSLVLFGVRIEDLSRVDVAWHGLWLACS